MKIDYNNKKILISLSEKEDLVNLDQYYFPILNERLNNNYLFLISSNKIESLISQFNLTLVENLKDLKKYSFHNPYLEEYWLKEPSLVFELLGNHNKNDLDKKEFQIKPSKDFLYELLRIDIT